jgi:hypothetical protein
MHPDLQSLLGVISGIGLAAACGFRIFVPLLIASLAVRSGVLSVSEGFEWLGSTPVLIAFAVATLFEVAGYYLPGVDHFLDVVATPAAVIAGTLVSASFITDVEPWFRWTLALVAGGGLAGVVQTSTVVARSASGLTTLGLANPIVATAELVGSSLVATLAVLVPLAALLCVLVGAALFWNARRRKRIVHAA